MLNVAPPTDILAAALRSCRRHFIAVAAFNVVSSLVLVVFDKQSGMHALRLSLQGCIENIGATAVFTVLGLIDLHLPQDGPAAFVAVRQALQRAITIGDKVRWHRKDGFGKAGLGRAARLILRFEIAGETRLSLRVDIRNPYCLCR